MAEVKRIRTYYEGDDDRVILEGLQALQLLPANCEIARRSRQHPGKDGLVHDLAPFVRPANGVGGSAIVLVDLDHLTPDELFTWFGKQLAEEMKEPAAPPKLELKRSDKARSGLFSLTSVDRIGQV